MPFLRILETSTPRRPLGCALAMRVLQSDLYRGLDDTERADCDELVRRNLDWCKADASGVLAAPVRLDDAALRQWLVDVQENAANSFRARNAAALLLAEAAPLGVAPSGGETVCRHTPMPGQEKR